MARSIDQIIQELDASYNPQRQSIQQRIDALPAQADAEIEGLKATQTQAFDNILSGARQRGVGAWGIPMEEQNKYTSSQFLPAVARVRQSQNETKMSLFDALNGINTDQRKYAMGIQQQELDREEQVRQANMAAAAQRAQSANLSGLFGGSVAGASTPKGATISQRGDKGFNFTDANGRPISAAQYSQIKGIPFRDLLTQMAKSGDAGAQQALGFVGNDYGYNKAKLQSAGNQNIANVINALLWGVNGGAAYNTARPYTAPAAPAMPMGVGANASLNALNAVNRR